MKKLFLFLLPIFTYAQITKAYNDNLGEHIGLHIIYFLGRVNGGVSLGKLPDVNGREYHQLIWTNRYYDKKEERTIHLIVRRSTVKALFASGYTGSSEWHSNQNSQIEGVCKPMRLNNPVCRY